MGASIDHGKDPPLAAAAAASNLGTLDEATFAGLTTESSRIRVPPGSTIHREGDQAPHLDLVLSGLLRVYVTAVDGRTLTIRYCRRGSLLGVASLFAPSLSLPASVKSVTETELLALRPAVVLRAAEGDFAVARALLTELSERVLSFASEIPGSAFASVRQRVARHLLDMAAGESTGPEPEVRASQQEVADAVGSVREVVVRALRDFRQDGMVATGRGGIKLLDPERLSAVAYPAARGTEVPRR